MGDTELCGGVWGLVPSSVYDVEPPRRFPPSLQENSHCVTNAHELGQFF